ncbi:hypothetical protein [Streptomyces wuyuanensis]|uniref:hypothetical protein n=1 Tax=Streptomyces wuyuanensis TaxID=1196353 RepID=UPI00342274E3
MMIVARTYSAFYEASAESCLLRYSAKIPSRELVHAGKLVDLSFSAINESGSPVSCAGITLSIPLGNGETDLATDEPATVQVGQDWTCTSRVDGKRLVIEARPAGSAGVNIPDGQEVFICRLNGLPVSGTAGKATIGVLEQTVPQRQTDSELEVSKFTSGFAFDFFHPEHISVPKGGTAELRWHGQGVESYRLTYTPPLDPNDKDTSKATVVRDLKGPYPPTTTNVGPITGRTAFALQAHVNVKGVGLDHTLTTMVDVASGVGDLAVHDITVDGTATFNNATGLLHTEPEQTRKITISRNNPGSLLTFRSAGEGFLSLHTDTGTTGVVELWLCDGSVLLAQIGKYFPCTVPLTAGQELTLVPDKAALQAKPASYTQQTTVYIRWSGLGTDSALTVNPAT